MRSTGNNTTGLAISVLGPVRASVGGREVRIRSRKCRAVLAYLALSEARQETRERLVGLLWSESGEEKAVPRYARSCMNSAKPWPRPAIRG